MKTTKWKVETKGKNNKVITLWMSDFYYVVSSIMEAFKDNDLSFTKYDLETLMKGGWLVLNDNLKYRAKQVEVSMKKNLKTPLTGE